MATIETIRLPRAADPAALWDAAARQARAWTASRHAAVRDTIVLAPFAALLPPLRQAFAVQGGWQPRVETPLTLAGALAPPAGAPAGQVSGEPVLDRLVALQLLRRQPWVMEWTQAEGSELSHLAELLVQAAHALRTALHERPPAARAAFRAALREQSGGTAHPAAAEARLLRLAIDWVERGTAAVTDVLFTLEPAAWIVVRLGGDDALAQALLADARSPGLLLDADPDPDRPFERAPSPAVVRRVRCDDAEAEAQVAAAEVIEALNAGRTPVALVALDRERVRRVRALLERAAVPLVDETGWRLSTTRAAARVVALLRAAAPGAGRDALLDWLQTWPRADASALGALEALWRGRRRIGDRRAADDLWQAAQEHLAPLAAGGVRGLADWLVLLAEHLRSDGSFEELLADEAGRQVLALLRLDAPGAPSSATSAWQVAAGAVRMDLAAFGAWVHSTLDGAPFMPGPDPGAAVVLTPLARAIGRPFAQVVLASADHEHLGAVVPPPSLIGASLADALGIETAELQRRRQRLALAHLLRLPALTLLRRRKEADEPIGDSPDLIWLLAERARAAASPWPVLDVAPLRRLVAVHPLPMPMPSVAHALPAALSATAVQALRDCPYRFFARAVLRLDEPAELEAALAKRDYGEWLHLVLLHFHAGRAAGGDDAAQLAAAAERATAEQVLDEGDLLPFRASFEAFAPAYLAWLARREAAGWHWHSGEAEHRAGPATLAPTALRGRIDRIDEGADGTLFVLDYKTGSVSGLREQVREPLEDVQLAFYAALLEGEGRPLRAAYLALDGADAPVEIEHHHVQRSAQVLVEGLGHELARLRAGAPLPALGEGRVCELCEARGLCRRDHWTRDA